MMKALQTLSYRYLVITLSFVLNLSAVSQNTGTVYRQLVKRYGNVTPWGKGYILRVNSFYGFANAQGRILIPINNTRFDTLFPDRASVCGPAGGLVDEYGNFIVGMGFCVDRVVNRQHRLMAATAREGNEVLCNDKGQWITKEYDATLPKETLIASMAPGGGVNALCGVMTIGGEIVLPISYQSVSCGRKICAGMRNDTAFVFNDKGILLFQMGGVHGCVVLANDFIGVQKYGVHALVNRSGRVLTGFLYQKLEALMYTDSVVWENKLYRRQQFEPTANFILTEQWGQPGLIDSSGKELLPMEYQHITRNRNGWFILSKATTQELVNSKFERVLKGESFSIFFLNDRYVDVTDGPYEYKRIRTYDMVLKRFVKHPPEPAKKEEENIYPIVTYPVNPMQANRDGSDSLVINEAGSLLTKEKGRWGVRSLLGDTILPFVYDTAGRMGSQFFAGRNKMLAPLDWEGNLVYPMGLPEFSFPWVYGKDSLAFLAHAVYSYKGGRLRKVDLKKEGVMDYYTSFHYGIAYTDGSRILKRGFYNRKMKHLGELPYGTFDVYNPVQSRFVAIRDSVKGMITLVDSTGKTYFPWIKESAGFILRRNYAFANYGEGQPAVLFRFGNGETQYDLVFLDKEQRITPDQANAGIFVPILIDKPGYGKGALYYEHALLIKGAEEVQADENLVMVRIGSKWGMYAPEGKQILACEYDSIEARKPYATYHKMVYQNGKVGIFDLERNKLYPPAYDSVAYGASMYYHFFIGYTNGQAAFVNDKGRIISEGWEDVKRLDYMYLDNIVAKRNGKTYVLHPSEGDILVAELVAPAEDTGQLLNDFDGYEIVSKDNLRGVYDAVRNQWLIRPEYQEMKWSSGFFIGYKYTPDYSPISMTLFTSDGILMFSLKKIYSYPKPISFNQWLLSEGQGGDIVVNCHGKLIVPDTLDNISALQKKGPPMYQATAKNGKKTLIDTSGKVLIPAILDEINAVSMYDGYFTVSIGEKSGLVSPAGKQLTRCVYSGIWDVKRKDRWVDYSEQAYYEPPLTEEEPFFIVSAGEEGSTKFGLLDRNGKMLIPCIYDDISAVQNGKTVIAKLGNYWGLVTVTNKPVAGFKYDLIEMYDTEKIGFERSGVSGYLSEDGKEVPY